MLYVLLGEQEKKEVRLQELLGRESLTYTDISFSKERLFTHAGERALFGTPPVILISHICDTASLKDELLSILETLVDSETVFILSEKTLLAKDKKVFEKKGATIESFEIKKKEKKEEVFNVFAFTDAVADKKRARAWSLYRRALFLGLEPRELHSKLFWIIKTLLLAKESTSAKESGLHPFVYQKSKKQSEGFTKNELQKHSGYLAHLFHEAQFTDTSLEVELEKFLLTALA